MHHLRLFGTLYTKRVVHQVVKYWNGYIFSEHLSNPENLERRVFSLSLLSPFYVTLPPSPRAAETEAAAGCPYFGRNSKSTRQSAASRDRRGSL